MKNRSVFFVFLALLVSPALSLATPKKLPDMKEADAFVTKAFGEECDRHPTGDAASEIGSDERFEITYRKKNDTEDRVFPLFQMYCTHGLYWEENVFLTLSKHGNFSIVTFPRPKVKYEYEDEKETKLKHPPKITRMGSTNTLSNAEFDPETNTIISTHDWGAWDDAYDTSTNIFSEGKFVLKNYVIDPIREKNLPESEAAALANVNYTLIPAE